MEQGCDYMNIGDARKAYSAKIGEFWDKKLELAQKKKDLEARRGLYPDDAGKFSEEAAVLELSYNAVSEKYEEYKGFMAKLMEMHSCIANAESAKQQGEAMKEYGIELSKLLEVARRISKGATVPAQDEKKLMDYSMELYMSAKNMAMLNKLKEKEEYDSLWEDEEEPEERESAMDIADSAEVTFDAPELVEVADVMPDSE